MSAPNPDTEAVCDELSRYLSAVVLGGAKVSRETDLSELGIDSFAMIELVLVLERVFGRRLELELLTPENTRSIAALASCYVRAWSAALG